MSGEDWPADGFVTLNVTTYASSFNNPALITVRTRVPVFFVQDEVDPRRSLVLVTGRIWSAVWVPLIPNIVNVEPWGMS